jgi:hypothetical protein
MNTVKSIQKIDALIIKVGKGAPKHQSTAEQRKSFFKHAVLVSAFEGESIGQSQREVFIPTNASLQQKLIPHLLIGEGIFIGRRLFKHAPSFPTKISQSSIITLRLTFGGAPCPYEWGVISESICDLANKLIKCDKWDPLTLTDSTLRISSG